jgi:acetyl-CoA acetyltransferase
MADQRAAIVGVATTAFARRIPDKSVLGLSCEAARKAADDAGIGLHDIDGILVQENRANPRFHLELSEALGLYDKPLCATIGMGGASAGYAVDVARWALRSGRCSYVLVVAAGKESAEGRSARGHGNTDRIATWAGHSPDYEQPYGPIMASYYGSVAQRHMYEYGTTVEQLASVSVAMRHNASLNPDAVYRTPITHDDVLDSRMISSPLHLLHCCVINDGGMAYILTTEERARDLRQPPVYVLGTGGGHAGYWTGFLVNGDPAGRYTLTRTLAERAGAQAFAEAGVERADIDLVGVCDNFAITPIVLLEDYGFCKKGEGGAFVGNGDRIKVGGALPVNPHGGALSCNHAGINHHSYVEAVLQLRGQAGERQVRDAKLALATATAGIVSTHQAAVLGNE